MTALLRPRKPTPLDVIVLVLIALIAVVVMEGLVIRDRSAQSRRTLAVLICQPGNTADGLRDLGFTPAQIARQLHREAVGRRNLLEILGDHRTCDEILAPAMNPKRKDPVK